MEPMAVTPGTREYVSALVAVSQFIGDPAHLVWYSITALPSVHVMEIA
jgi:hypothetical protein